MGFIEAPGNSTATTERTMPTEDSEMDSLYSEPEATSQETPPETPEGDTKPEDEAEDMGESAIVPTKLLSGAKEGDTITLKVVKLYGDEAEITALPGKSTQTKSDVDEEIDALASER